MKLLIGEEFEAEKKRRWPTDEAWQEAREHAKEILCASMAVYTVDEAHGGMVGDDLEEDANHIMDRATMSGCSIEEEAKEHVEGIVALAQAMREDKLEGKRPG